MDKREKGREGGDGGREKWGTQSVHSLNKMDIF